MAHTCHAAGCETPCPPRMFMCRPHWFALPKRLQNLVWRYYSKGQESRGGVTYEYLYTSQMVVEWLADAEGVPHDGYSDSFRDMADDDCVAAVAKSLALVRRPNEGSET